ncbi:MAG: DUF2752 domain-containing protein [Salinimicrobium sp.]
MLSINYKIITRLGLLLLALGLLFLYGRYDPTLSAYFPACPFHSFTGLLCPGCGSQRALHHLLNLELAAAFQQNPLLLLSMPYVAAGYAFELVPVSEKAMRWRNFFFGRKAILFVLLLVISFWILRNL